MKILYNVDDRLLELCQIEEIGKATAEKLYNMGIKNAIDIVNASDQKLMKIRGIGENKLVKIKSAAIKFLLEHQSNSEFEDQISSQNLEAQLKKYSSLFAQLHGKDKSIYETIES